MAGFIGPALPPGLQQNPESDEEKRELIGPALPKSSDDTDSVRIGPPLLPGFCGPTTSESSEGDLTALNKDNSMYGPALPPGSDRGATSYGPTLPPGLKLEEGTISCMIIQIWGICKLFIRK